MQHNNVPTEILHKEIDLIQSCIDRMSRNCFLLKGWFLSIIAIISALIPKGSDFKSICFIILAIGICFWYLDGYFLKLERLYRKKYEWIITERFKSNCDFLYDLNPYNKKMWLNPDKKVTQLNSFFSLTLILFYGITMSLTLIVLIKL